MKKETLLLLLLFILPQFYLLAQTPNISGTVIDETTNEPLIGATVIITSEKDTTSWKGAATDVNGLFKFESVANGTFELKVSFISYEPFLKKIKVNRADMDLGVVKMKGSLTTLNTYTVEGRVQRAQLLGDTTQYNANAFKTNPDANTEDLVTKMPGVTSENGTLKVNGENVQRVLVDGKPFFGDDPNMALKNLPAEIVDKIQVFDQQSEQAQFSGFDDGQTTKTINIVTKQGIKDGQFGRVYAGYGTDDRYTAGGNINFFKEDRRISIVGLTNNINQQNFSSEDLVGVMAGSSGGGGNRGGGSRGGQGGGGRGPSGGGGNNFLKSQQPGIANTHSIGLNYSDVWGSKIKVSGSYFFNNSDNTNNSSLSRAFITSIDSGLYYTEQSYSTNNNYNHRFDARLEYSIDSFNSIVVTPKLSFQQNYSDVVLSGITSSGEGNISGTQNQNNSINGAYNFSNNLLFRHRFQEKGRTLSIGINTSLSNNDGERILNSSSQYADLKDSVINQRTLQETNNFTLSSNISYTEPLGKFSQLQLNYSPSYRMGNTDKATRNFDDLNQKYFQIDTTLSNEFDNVYTSQKGGMSYRFNNKKINFSTGLNVQYSTLSSDQTFPYSFQLEKSFSNILPEANFNYKFSKEENLRVFYRTNTSAPSVNQLQNVLDNSNQLFLSSGNADLKQEYSHSLSLRYGNTNTTKATSLFLFANASFTNNYIANATYLATSEVETVNGIELRRGSQLSMPVNLDGNWTSRTFLTYGLPVSVLKSNLNLNTGFTYNSTPGLINNQKNMANNYNISQGVVLSSNISEKIDLNISFTGNYSIVRNTLQKQSDNNYYSQNTSVKFNWLPWKGLVFNTNITHSLYSGLSQSFNQEFLLWNASLGYKMLNDKSLEFKLSVFDILNENNSISRSVTDTYIQDSQTTVLTKYLMFTLSYNIRNFKA